MPSLATTRGGYVGTREDFVRRLVLAQVDGDRSMHIRTLTRRLNSELVPPCRQSASDLATILDQEPRLQHLDDDYFVLTAAADADGER
jgi:hypothetical protein